MAVPFAMAILTLPGAIREATANPLAAAPATTSTERILAGSKVTSNWSEMTPAAFERTTDSAVSCPKQRASADLANPRALAGAADVNVAVTARAWDIVTWQAAVPVQPSPVQPLKTDPESAIAVSVTSVPAPNAAAHPPPQLIPAGLLVTVPPPVPVLVTVSVCGVGGVYVTTRVSDPRPPKALWAVTVRTF